MNENAFKPGDIVKCDDGASGVGRELEVVGTSDRYPGMVLCCPVGTAGVRIPYWPHNLKLVRAAEKS